MHIKLMTTQTVPIQEVTDQELEAIHGGGNQFGLPSWAPRGRDRRPVDRWYETKRR